MANKTSESRNIRVHYTFDDFLRELKREMRRATGKEINNPKITKLMARSLAVEDMVRAIVQEQNNGYETKRQRGRRSFGKYL